jgi:hypothetical protein
VQNSAIRRPRRLRSRRRRLTAPAPIGSPRTSSRSDTRVCLFGTRGTPSRARSRGRWEPANIRPRPRPDPSKNSVPVARCGLACTASGRPAEQISHRRRVPPATASGAYPAAVECFGDPQVARNAGRPNALDAISSSAVCVASSSSVMSASTSFGVPRRAATWSISTEGHYNQLDDHHEAAVARASARRPMQRKP